MPSGSVNKICMHCGSVDAERIGYCDECGTAVCEMCGNTQISLTERKVMHDSCLRDHADKHFSMIKFVK